jgi:hypothetical protein
VTAAYTARARTLVTKMMFWALAGVTFSAAKIVSCNNNWFFHGLPSTLLNCSTLEFPIKFQGWGPIILFFLIAEI